MVRLTSLILLRTPCICLSSYKEFANLKAPSHVQLRQMSFLDKTRL